MNVRIEIQRFFTLFKVHPYKMYNVKHYVVETQLIYVVKDLITAGVDTTDNTIGFTLAYLVVHQCVQLKLHDEIDRVIGKDICPSLSDKRR